MRRRVMIGKRELVEVVEELKSSGTWMVPAGCKFVDVFIVGGGGSGASSGPERGGGGGGEYSSGSSQGGIGIGGGSLGNPTNGKPNTGSGGGSFYISGSNVSGGCYSGAGGSGIIILRYMKYK